MTRKAYDALSIPPGARKGGREVLRAGVTEQHFAMSIRRAFDDPAAWGALLATAGRQVARIYAKDVGLDENQVLARILESFEAEMRSTGDPGTITPTS